MKKSVTRKTSNDLAQVVLTCTLKVCPVKAEAMWQNALALFESAGASFRSDFLYSPSLDTGDRLFR
jgi:hypothetical protein